jgi:large subunit ribosomal protein L25
MYGNSGSAQAVDLDALEFTKGIKGVSESTIIQINIDGNTHEAFIKDTQRDIISGKVLHVDFYEVAKGQVLHARVPLHIVGTAFGIRAGGIFENPLHEIEVVCLAKDLPEFVEVDVSALDVNQAIHVRDLKIDASVKVNSNSDQVVALVKYAKAEAASEAPAAAAAAAPAAAAPKA